MRRLSPRLKRKTLLLVLLFCCGLAVAAEESRKEAWKGSADAMLYAYPEFLSLTKGSVLNPGNRFAALSNSSLTGEVRLNLRLEDPRFRLSLRPILSAPEDAARLSHPRGYLSQWQARAVLPENLALSVGREVMNWGPAQFRSPSSPFYFDNGRANPLRELSGVDAAKMVWTPDRSHALSLAYVQDSGHNALPRLMPDPWRNTWLLHGDVRGDDWTGGLVLAKPAERSLFVGTHLQQTMSDAWLLYGELASSTRPNVLLSPTNLAEPFTLRAESPRASVGLIGATVTFENGQSLSAEVLHDGHGYSKAESSAYFARAATAIPAAALALLDAPPLLNKDYLHLVWQNNLLDGDDYWRLMLSRNLADDSASLAAYFEQPLDSRLTFFLMGVVNSGGVKREFSSIIENSITLGLRLALP